MPKKGSHRLVSKSLRLVAAKNVQALMRAFQDEGLGTYTEVATKAGIGRNTVKRLYLGHAGITLDTLEAVAGVFDAAPWMLLVEGMRPSEMPLLAPGAEEKALYRRVKGLEAKLEVLEQTSPPYRAARKRRRT
jgi:transcriptional regulator with XRE-family HTH domain